MAKSPQKDKIVGSQRSAWDITFCDDIAVAKNRPYVVSKSFIKPDFAFQRENFGQRITTTEVVAKSI